MKCTRCSKDAFGLDAYRSAAVVALQYFTYCLISLVLTAKVGRTCPDSGDATAQLDIV